jgi:hypothetical protein
MASGSSTATSGGSSATAPGTPPGMADVTVSSCALADNQFEGPEAKLTVLNHSSKPSNYIITVAFQSKDGTQQLDTGTATVQTLQPNQSTNVSATSTNSSLRSQSGFTCKVTQVDRLAS